MCLGEELVRAYGVEELQRVIDSIRFGVFLEVLEVTITITEGQSVASRTEKCVYVTCLIKGADWS